MADDDTMEAAVLDGFRKAFQTPDEPEAPVADEIDGDAMERAILDGFRRAFQSPEPEIPAIELPAPPYEPEPALDDAYDEIELFDAPVETAVDAF